MMHCFLMAEDNKTKHDDEKYDISWIFNKKKDEKTEEEAENFFWKYHGGDAPADESVQAETEHDDHNADEQDPAAENSSETSNSAEQQESTTIADASATHTEISDSHATINTATTTNIENTAEQINDTTEIDSKESDPLRIPEILGGTKETRVNKKFSIKDKIGIMVSGSLLITSFVIAASIFFFPAKNQNLAIKIAAANISTGDMLLVDTVNYPDSANALLNTGQENRQISTIMEQIIKAGDIVIDVGSGHGYYSFLMSHLVGKTGKVYSFEANPHLTSLLKKSLKLNGIRNVLPYNRVVATRSGSVKVNTSAKKHKLEVVNDKTRTDLESYKSIKLDAIISKAPQVSVIHINAGGNEADILAGAMKIISQSPKIKIFTTWSNEMHGNIDITKLISHMLKMDMKFWAVNQKSHSLIPLQNLEQIMHSSPDYMVIAKNL